MAPFSSLPVELLEHIAGYVMPEDIENFAQTSKHIRSVSIAALENHRQLNRKFAVISARSATATKTVKLVLEAVLAGPRIGHYVKKIQLCGAGPDSFEDLEGSDQENETGDWGNATNVPADDPDWGWDVEPDDAPRGIDQIRAAIDEGKLLDPGHLAQIYNNSRTRHDCPLLALLLPLLPNLTELSLLDAYYPHGLYEMIKKAKEHKIPILNRLHHVRTLAMDLEDPEVCMTIDDLKVYLLIPTLRKLTGAWVWHTQWGKTHFESQQPSNITELELRKCMIESKILACFLRHCPHLQTFLYTVNDDYINWRQDYPDEFVDSLCDPWIICAALEAQVATSLQRLTILMRSRKHRPTFMGSLRGFKALEYVHSEPGCLLPNEGYRGTDEGTFSSTLPKSLRILKVRCHGEMNWYPWGLIEESILAKTDRDAPLRHFKTLMFESTPAQASYAQERIRDGDGRAWQKRCDELGLSLHFRPQQHTRNFGV